MKNEKKHHGVVDEPSSQQQFRKLDMCEKSGAILIVPVGLTAGWR